MDTYYKIPKRLEEYRRKLSYTQEQMGEMMGLGQDHYQRVEQGSVIISYNGLHQIEDHGGDIYYLITGKRQKPGYINKLLEECNSPEMERMLLRCYLLYLEAGIYKAQGKVEEEICHYLRMAEATLKEDTIWRGIRISEQVTHIKMAEMLEINRKRYAKLENKVIGADAYLLNQLYRKFHFFPFQIFEKGNFYLNELNQLQETLPDSIQEEIEWKLKEYMLDEKRGAFTLKVRASLFESENIVKYQFAGIVRCSRACRWIL